MNFVSLVIHGLSAISVFGDVVGVRLLLMALFLVAATLAGVGVVVAFRFLTDLAIPGWATSAVGLLLPTYPAMLILAGAAGHWFRERGRVRWIMSSAVLLGVFLLAGECFATYPH